LGTLQFLNYLFPLITFPYLVRVLGVEKFGLISFAAAFINYFVIITDYGFNYTAVRAISINRNDKTKLSEIISSVYAVKFILFLISALLFGGILYLYESFSKESELYIASFIFTVGSLILPSNYFQGIEKTKNIALVTFIIRLIWVLGVFSLITSPDDYIMLAYLNSFSWLVIGFILALLMVFRYRIKLVVPAILQVIEQFKEGGVLFISNISINLYTTSNIFILGLLTNNTVVGYFSAADKIRLAVQSLFNPFTQAMYPHLSTIFNNDRTRAYRIIIKSLKSIGLLSFIISALLLFFSEEIVILLLGQQYTNSIYVLKIISFLPFIIYLSNLFGIQTMLNMGHRKAFASIISSAAVVSLIIAFILIPVYKEIGTSITMLITELFVTISVILYLIKKGFFLEKEI
jgi:PST family polysaccharide transporter